MVKVVRVLEVVLLLSLWRLGSGFCSSHALRASRRRHIPLAVVRSEHQPAPPSDVKVVRRRTFATLAAVTLLSTMAPGVSAMRDITPGEEFCICRPDLPGAPCYGRNCNGLPRVTNDARPAMLADAASKQASESEAAREAIARLRGSKRGAAASAGVSGPEESTGTAAAAE
eukprot:CAMPEP_0119486520 /NCGR_PEP_ID=MMETSP1344-20130328/12896_1 /TAXON_ID=236787 /ORGANISM="Florenciella parvula, Strain CCMP2471" /LENGTH=170 /DNA_ID=CAMNT_0007521291 /DNA_START=62 /DNA_END=574 /DNA_ORIENTATION=+